MVLRRDDAPRMDNATKLLEEIRDLLRQQAEAAAAERAANKAYRELIDQRTQQSFEQNRRHWRLYRVAVTVGGVVVAGLLIVVFWLLKMR